MSECLYVAGHDFTNSTVGVYASPEPDPSGSGVRWVCSTTDPRAQKYCDSMKLKKQEFFAPPKDESAMEKALDSIRALTGLKKMNTLKRYLNAFGIQFSGKGMPAEDLLDRLESHVKKNEEDKRRLIEWNQYGPPT